MKLDKLNTLDVTLINPVALDKEIKTVYIGDLLSSVMVNGKSAALWLTVQTHSTVIAIAQLKNFVGIVFVQNSYPDEATIEKAQDRAIPLFVSSLDAYTLVKQLIALGI